MNAVPDAFRVLPVIAREAIGSWLRRVPYEPPPLPVDDPHGVFVTLWDATDELRGCIGHIEPTRPRVSQEVAVCAVLAASQDPRFTPLREREFDDVRIEVSVLTPPEPVADLSTLDPSRYGVVVAYGMRRGVLLPDVRGVETVEDQLRIALRKGGIRPTDPWVATRFEVIKIKE